MKGKKNYKFRQVMNLMKDYEVLSQNDNYDCLTTVRLNQWNKWQHSPATFVYHGKLLVSPTLVWITQSNPSVRQT